MEIEKKKWPSHKYTQMRQNSNLIYFIPRYQKCFSIYKTMWGHGPKSNLEIPDEHHTKGLWQEVKTEIYNLDQLATDCCQFDFEKYPLSTMKLNPQIDKNTQTIQDGSTLLKQASEWFGSVLNLVVYNRTLLSKRELGFEWT